MQVPVRNIECAVKHFSLRNVHFWIRSDDGGELSLRLAGCSADYDRSWGTRLLRARYGNGGADQLYEVSVISWCCANR